MAIRIAEYSRDADDTGRLLIVRSFHVDTEAEIDQVVTANPAYNGLGRRPDYHAENWDPDTIEAGFRVDLTFEGPDLTNGKNDPEDAKWNFDPAFEKEPIEKHPDVSFLIENYGGREDPKTGRLSFDRLIARTSVQSGVERRSGHWIGTSTESTEEVDNPIYGLSESGYLVMLGSASARYNTVTPATAMRDIGKIFNTLPYNAPDYGVDEDERNWLKAPPRINELEPLNGERWHAVEEVFLLSEIGGWPPVVYKFINV